MKYILSFLFCLTSLITSQAQDINPVTWDYEQEVVDGILELRFIATIEDSWYLYSQEVNKDGPIPTSFHIEDYNLESVILEETSKHPVNVFDEMFGMELMKYKDQVIFTARIPASEDVETIKGYLEFMCCNSTQCLPPKQIEFTFNLNNK